MRLGMRCGEQLIKSGDSERNEEESAEIEEVFA